MTQLPELLRDARPVAPSELRERVRLIAAPEPVARRRVPWRRVSLAAVPAALAAAAIAGVVVGLRDRGAQPRPAVLQGGAATADSARAGLQRVAPTVLPPSSTRFQDYRASLTLEVPNANAVSDRTKRAVRIAQRLGGSVARVDVGTSGRAGNSYIVLRVPVDKVTRAVAQLGALGRIVDQHVAVVDVQQRIRQLREKVRTTSGEERKAAQQQLFQELRRARLSTISLELRTPEPVAAVPRHESTAGRILHAEGRVALYTALIGGPLLALGLAVWLVWRGVRRASERRLLGA